MNGNATLSSSGFRLYVVTYGIDAAARFAVKTAFDYDFIHGMKIGDL